MVSSRTNGICRVRGNAKRSNVGGLWSLNFGGQRGRVLCDTPAAFSPAKASAIDCQRKATRTAHTLPTLAAPTCMLACVCSRGAQEAMHVGTHCSDGGRISSTMSPAECHEACSSFALGKAEAKTGRAIGSSASLTRARGGVSASGLLRGVGGRRPPGPATAKVG
ncbi:hypothetical protein chiPu_0029344 [Chiloscyllium punctatum]|uniref:Uncharacterized protein n=1 Tax=Chiloscyllium punctatum TaxID=137246 RepID=A0A401TRP9_CHIPU|nr:hypothetical protein [Chiloscyllium punctatum]